MTDNEIKKLSRAELLEILIEQNKAIERLQKELDGANAKLADRDLKLAKAGSLAEAALALSGVFEAADEAAKSYIENAELLYDKNKRLYAKLQEREQELGGGE